MSVFLISLPLNQEILHIEGENQVGEDQQAGPTLHSVAITTDVLVYDGAPAAAEVSSLMESLYSTKLGDGEGAVMWPLRTFDRCDRLRLVTSEPAKLQEAVPIRRSRGRGLDWGYVPLRKGRRRVASRYCIVC